MTGGLFPLWHLARQREWEEARSSGVYLHATRDRTLGDEGFIHCSYPHQLGFVARTFYAEETEPLVILEIDRERLGRTPVKVEDAPGTGQRFPHLYGPLPVDAVVLVLPVEFDEGGTPVIGNPMEQGEV